MGTPDRGPYYDTGFDYLQPIRTEDGQLRVAPQLQRLYLSASAIAAFLAENGSPYVPVPAADYATLLAKATELEAANDRLAELEGEVSEYAERNSIIDGNAIAAMVSEGLIERLDERYSRKRGKAA